MSRVHHLDCGTLCPVAGALVAKAELVCHCVLVERPGGLVLVDTGLGLADLAEPRSRLGSSFVAVARPRLDAASAAVRQVEALGFDRRDVRDVVVTHLDLDHAGGLADFPEARVHVHRAEHDAATARATWRERERYREVQWAHGPRWVLHEAGGERWNGFESVRCVGDDVLLLPLPGHSRGHSAVVVLGGAHTLVHAGDAYFDRREMDLDAPTCAPGLALFQRAVAFDDEVRRENQERLRELARREGERVTIFSSHDPDEWRALRG